MSSTYPAGQLCTPAKVVTLPSKLACAPAATMNVPVLVKFCLKLTAPELIRMVPLLSSTPKVLFITLYENFADSHFHDGDT